MSLNDPFKITEEVDDLNKAVRLFTDREAPQEAFERKLKVVSENMDSFYVLCYYGIGGIGKTSFVEKLCRLINQDKNKQEYMKWPVDCYYVVHNFGLDEIPREKLDVLRALRNQICEKLPGAKFYRFDTAVEIYAKKTGVYIHKQEKEDTLFNNPWLETTYQIASDWIGNVGLVKSVLDSIRSVTKVAKDTVNKKKHEQFLNDLRDKEGTRILEDLHVYFSQDMRENMSDIDKPLVVFLDTYERFVDTFKGDGVPIVADDWLRKGKRSVIRSVPGVLWVITGREKLDWSDDVWDDDLPERPLSELLEEEKEKLAKQHLEQHLIGDLSEKDAVFFLEKAGVKEAELRKELYHLTKGTPLYLDLCVGIYERRKSCASTLSIEDFGQSVEELIPRYMYHLPSYARELAYFFACVETWTEKDVDELVKRVSCLKEYSKARYLEFMKHSFIIRNVDDTCYIHETVRAAIEKNVEESFRQNVLRAMVDYEKDFTRWISHVMKVKWEKSELQEIEKNIRKGFSRLWREGRYAQYEVLSERLLNFTEEYFPNESINVLAKCERIYVILLKGYVSKAMALANELEKNLHVVEGDKLEHALNSIAAANCRAGNYKRAFEITEESYKRQLAVYGEDDLGVLFMKRRMAGMHLELGNYQEAVSILRETCEKYAEIAGATDWETLSAQQTLTTAYNSNGQYKEAIALGQTTYEQMVEKLGAEHPDSLSMLGTLAISYRRIGNYCEAEKIIQSIYEKRMELYGEMHSSVITSLGNLANVYSEQGKDREALRIYQDIYEMENELYGEENPSTLGTLTGIAVQYRKTGKFKEALELNEELYEKQKRVLGENHPDTLMVLGNLAIDYRCLGKYDEAIQLNQELYEKRKAVYGEMHPDVLMAQGNLGNVYSSMKNYRMAFEIKKDVLKKREQTLGKQHPGVISLIESMAEDFYHMGMYEAFEVFTGEAVKRYDEILDENDEKLLKAAYRWMFAQGLLKEYEEAIETGEILATKCLEVLGEEHKLTKSVCKLLEEYKTRFFCE